MAFCPRCGAPTTPGMRFCGSCGESLASNVAPPPPPPPASAPAAPHMPPPSYAPPPPRATGPPGAVREPIVVILLALVTLGFYGLYYWWVVSREVDDYTQKPGHSHKLVMIGTIVSVVAGVVLFFAAISFIGTIIAEAADGQEPTEEEILGMVFGAMGTLFLFGTAAFVGSIIRLVGKWRLWSSLEADERARVHPAPLSPGLMLALVILAWFVPFVGWILPLVVMWMTQEHLNQAWQAAGVPMRT